MRIARPVLTASCLLGLALWSRPATAAVQLGLGADYWFEPERGEFQLTLAVDTPLLRHLALGGRFGAALFTSPDRVAVPIDLRLRVRLQGLYLEGLVGPWILFDEPDPVRAHAAFGFGLAAAGVQLGVEVGYLHPSTLAGLRLAFRI